MAKRKRSRKPPPKKKAEKLDTIFDCPFCGNEKCVEASIERRSSLGMVRCRMCDAKHSSKINTLEEAVDVYAAWIDETVKANELVAAEETGGGGVDVSGGIRAGGVDDIGDVADEDDDGEEERPRKRLQIRATGRDDAVNIDDYDDLDAEG